MRTLSLAVVLLLCAVSSAFPKGSRVIKDDPWNPHHIDDLPVEVRKYIAEICQGPPSAQRDFATYAAVPTVVVAMSLMSHYKVVAKYQATVRSYVTRCQAAAPERSGVRYGP